MENQKWTQFRENRNRTLPSPHGWLSLTSLQWLPESPGELLELPGSWSVQDGAATVTATAQDKLLLVHGEAPVTGTISARLEENESLNWLRHGSVLVELARRGGHYAIRTRDSEAPTLKNFSAVPSFDYNPDFLVSGRFTPYPDPQAREISTANPRVPGQSTVVGEISFELAGRPERLLAEQNGSDLLVNFHDPSNGELTAGWRFLSVPAPDASGQLELDFNYALNWPSGFSAYGTCPRPVPENQLSVPVLAGEKKL
ncbi:DUF1684 domain-containing protein [Psychromicrobium sp. YIM B11713]|uniref:DUF1684 domain-containing protein n=1 Tax=Psychromicrobium sp. YIM B11713 TaxID=3145233 RepID=UPI00374F5863